MVDEIEVSVSGLSRFKDLLTRLKDADKQVRLAFLRSVRAAVAPLKDDVRQSASNLLPKAGGLAARVAESKFSTRTGTSGVTFRTANMYDIKRMDQGKVRHPVFGNIKVWVGQPVRPGFWTTPIDQGAAQVRAAVDVAMTQAEKVIENG